MGSFSYNFKRRHKDWRPDSRRNCLKQVIIKEKAAVQVDLINKTLSVKNIGNIPYNSTINIRIGNTTKITQIYLPIDGEKKLTLTAPDGEYPVEILTHEGSKITGMATLTGSAINVGEQKWYSLMKASPLIWIFVLIILGFPAHSIYGLRFSPCWW